MSGDEGGLNMFTKKGDAAVLAKLGDGGQANVSLRGDRHAG
jgi:hypothetical protein